MFKRSRLTFAIFLITFGEFSFSIKWWNENSIDFFDSELWNEDSSPCALDTVVFPEQFNGAVYLPDTLDTRGLVLPAEGLILSPFNSRILFDGPETSEKKCKRRDRVARLKPVQLKFWFDPGNWRLPLKKEPSSAMPHIDRIPCSNEPVQISHRDPVSISLDQIDRLYIGDLNLHGQEMSSAYFENFLKTELGQMMFKDSEDTKVKYFDEPICGCHQPDDIVELEFLVCKYASKSCDVPQCLEPITPTGHCCAVCGSMVKLFTENCKSFNLKLFNDQVKNAISIKKLEKDLTFYASMVDEGVEKYLQLILLDNNGYDQKSIEFMEYLNETLFKKSYQNMPQSFHLSGLPYSPGSGISPWTFIFGTFLVVIVFFIAIYVHYHPENPYISVPMWLYPSRYRTPGSPFVFARFENAQAEAEVEPKGNVVMNVTYDEKESGNSETGTTSFDNPMFSGTSEQVDVAEIAETVEHELTAINLDTSDSSSTQHF